jgi:hypothetical protein
MLPSTIRPMRRRPRLLPVALGPLALGSLALGILGLGLPAGPAVAAEPSPSPFILEIQAWLDAPVPADAAPGTEVTVGAMIWDPIPKEFVFGGGTFMRLYPATGDGPASEVSAKSDFQGHVVGTLTVPDGGVGDLVIGITGSSCTPEKCSRFDSFFDMAGVGPPPDAPLPKIAAAKVQAPAVPTVGEPASVAIVLTPKVAWGPDVYTPPDRLVLRVRVPRGDVMQEVPAPLTDAATGLYEATVTLAEPGPVVLEAAVTEDAAVDQVFQASGATTTVVPPAEATPVASPDAPSAGAPSPAASPNLFLVVGLLLMGSLVLGLLLIGRRSSV